MQDVACLQLKCVDHAVSGGQQSHTFSQCSRLNGRDSGCKTRSSCTNVSVWFKNNLSCNTNGNRRVPDQSDTLAFADKCGFLQCCQLLVMISRLDGRRMGVQWKDFSFEWYYTPKMNLSRNKVPRSISTARSEMRLSQTLPRKDSKWTRSAMFPLSCRGDFLVVRTLANNPRRVRCVYDCVTSILSTRLSPVSVSRRHFVMCTAMGNMP